MTQEKILSLLFELAVLLFIAGIYYIWQRRRILYGPKNWQHYKLVEIYHFGLETNEPELHFDLVPFLDDCEQKLKSDYPWMDGAFISRWKGRKLPEKILAILSDCSEWHAQSQPKTR
jgi:hypothetical protein